MRSFYAGRFAGALWLLLAAIQFASADISTTSPVRMTAVANPPEVNLRNYNVIRFGPGNHIIKTLDIGDDSRIEIEAGAVVRGNLRARGSQNIIITGAGVIDLDGTASQRDGAGINLQYCHNVVIEGVSITNATLAGIEISSSAGISIRDITVSGKGPGNHGISLANTQDVIIERCYINSGASAVAITGKDSRYRTPSRNIVVRECRIKADLADALIIGPETRAVAISHVCFKDSTIVRSNNGPALSIQNGDSAIIRQIHYSNITVKKAGVRLADIWIGIAPASRDNVRGYVREIFFDNIKVTGGTFPPSSFFGFDEQHIVSYVHFNNLNIMGRNIPNAETGNFVLNRFTKNIIFTDQKTFHDITRQHGCTYISSPPPVGTSSTKYFTVSNGLPGKPEHSIEWNFAGTVVNDGIIKDSSAAQLPAALRNGVLVEANGIALDGVDDHIELGIAAPAGSWKLTMKFRVAGMISGMQTLLSNSPGYSTAGGFRLYVNDWGTDNRRIIFETGDGKSAKRSYTSPGAVPGNDWHTLIMTVDNVRGAAEFTVNGVKLTAEQEFIAGTAMHHPMRIGRTADGRFPFAGTIANVKLSAGNQP